MKNILSQAQDRVRAGLTAYFESGHGGMLDLPPWGSDVAARLSDYARRGKLLRGALVSLGYHLFRDDGEIPTVCVDAGVAMELLQSFLLIHDDIMDQDLLRRGGPSVHAQYTEACPVPNDRDRSALYGISLGICAGDVSAFLAMEILSTLDLPAERRIPIVARVSREITAVGLAQMQDVHHGYVDDVDEEAILRVYTYKTGRYTFSLPMSIGAAIAGAQEDRIDLLGVLGESLGRIFQIRDDQLGIFGDTQTIGKPAGSDVREDKKTIFRHFVAVEDRDGTYRDMFGRDTVSISDLENLREFIKSRGILARVDRLVEREADRVRELIGRLGLSGDRRSVLEDLLRYNLTRSF